MPQTRILKAESFRLAAIFTLVFLGLTAVLIGTVLWIVAGAERETLLAANDADIAMVMNGMQGEGIPEATEVVQQRRGTPGTYMVLQGPSGEVLAGNLPAVTCEPGVFTRAVSQPAGGTRSLLGRCAAIDATTTVYVARDTATLYATRRRILHAFGWVALGTCLSAILGGLFLGRRFMAQVDAITQTCERVIGGNLNERIPLRGRGDEWDRLARAINEMLDRISALLENLQQVSSDVAHDLRTPLTRLRHRLEAARDSSTDVAGYSRAITQALGDSDQLLSLFTALLRISQIEAGTRVRSFTPVDLSGLLERMFQIFLPVAEDCGRSLAHDSTPRLMVRGDPELLTQLFSNLIENALRHTPVGSAIRLAVTMADGRVVAAISDDGPGIPPEDRDKVTRRFYRGAASRSAEGHGLGLSLVAAIAQLHGATLELSQLQPGLRVAVSFRPLAPSGTG